jgi:prepilin-type N-terminal cleavage/methylation domain-containing protein
VSGAVRAEAGFTLIELVIAIVIGGILIGSIAGAVLTSLDIYSASGTRLVQSHDAQLVSSWLLPDVQSATTIDTAAGTTTTSCATSFPADSINVARLTWADTDPSSSATFEADYRTQSVADGAAPSARSDTAAVNAGSALVRYFCDNGGSPSETVVSHNVRSASAGLVGPSVRLSVVDVVDGVTYPFTVQATPLMSEVAVAPPPTSTSTTVPAGRPRSPSR